MLEHLQVNSKSCSASPECRAVLSQEPRSEINILPPTLSPYRASHSPVDRVVVAQVLLLAKKSIYLLAL